MTVGEARAIVETAARERTQPIRKRSASAGSAR
jgi:hypothetical protein